MVIWNLWQRRLAVHRGQGTMAGDSKKTVLITGCSSGIGLQIAAQLAKDPQERYYVIATMRDLGKSGKLEAEVGEFLNKTLVIRQLDVTKEDSVKHCLDALPGQRIDILVNNAGVGQIGPIESLSMEDMRKVFETNFFGVVHLIKAVLPGMKKRGSGHIVVISSVVGLQGVIFNDIYSASKFAIEGFCECLAVQLLKFNIFVSMIEPGPVNTEFEMKLMEEVSRSDFPGADADTIRYFKDIYLPSAHEIFSSIGQTPEAVAEATVKVIGMRQPVFRHQTNVLYTPLTAMKYADNTGNLSIRTFYNLLFNYGTLFHFSLGFLRCITCNCFRRRVMPV
ncbi:retinol dehydrogenase 8 [Xenopus laevis]|uniref:Retinol dehydrogenase 8 n=2 Tax=Xenopus laevis TaxID=8355 RepID=A0A8J0UPA1_XENLA|nr:retinol dehydrogenase 8 [Xenopus laevis]